MKINGTAAKHIKKYCYIVGLLSFLLAFFVCSQMIRYQEKEKKAVFSVADKGTGIAKEDIPNVFKMFYTTNRRGADTSRGIGLGLAICESIITAHGGKICVQSRKDTKGAEFIFTLPMGE